MKHIYNIHHYLGTIFFTMFLIWFLSGFVMMYKSFPFLLEEDRIAKQEIVQVLDDDLRHPADVFSKHKNESINSLRVNSILGRPVYHLLTGDEKLVSRFADDGESVNIDTAIAKTIASDFTGIGLEAKVTVLDYIDQWLPNSKYLKHLPVYKVSYPDDAGTYVHISSKTGEVLSNTSRSDRIWAWLGAIPHWIYLKDIRVHGTLWSQICIWLSVLGFVMSLSGIITGIARYRKKPKANFKRFKNKWYNIHYYTGLAFGLFVCTWIFSGFMSMSPFNWSYDYTLSASESLLWAGGEKSLADITEGEWTTFQGNIESNSVKEAHFSTFDSKLFTKLFMEDAEKSICLSTVNYRLVETDLAQQINRIDDTSSKVRFEVLEAYDNYYYDRHNLKKLPVLKGVTDKNIAYYIDPESGMVYLRSDITNKIERWLYHGLHSLDFKFLINNRPLWDIVMIVLLLGGTAICATAVGLGIKSLYA